MREERGVNEDDIIPLTEFARQNDFHVRFIEYLDVGNANNWMSTKVISKEEILRRIADRSSLERLEGNYGNAPAVDYHFIDGGAPVGVIASMTEPFCSKCSRARLTADGKLVTCLFARRGHDLKTPLGRGAGDEEIAALISSDGKREQTVIPLKDLQLSTADLATAPENTKDSKCLALATKGVSSLLPPVEESSCGGARRHE